jgi:hypothetical protein
MVIPYLLGALVAQKAENGQIRLDQVAAPKVKAVDTVVSISIKEKILQISLNISWFNFRFFLINNNIHNLTYKSYF